MYGIQLDQSVRDGIERVRSANAPRLGVNLRGMADALESAIINRERLVSARRHAGELERIGIDKAIHDAHESVESCRDALISACRQVS